MKYEIAINNLRGCLNDEFSQIIIEVQQEIPEPGTMKLMDRIKSMFTIYKGIQTELNDKELMTNCIAVSEELTEFRYWEIIRKINEKNTNQTKQRNGFFNDPDRGQIWKLSKEFGWAHVKVLAATVDRYTVSVVKSNKSRLKTGAEFHIAKNDVHHFGDKIR